jgi:predicted glycosyltransferase
LTPSLKNPFGRRPAPADGPPRILAYCASNVGMGHYCRLMRVLGELRRRRPELDILLITDAPDLTLARQLGLAVVHLPRFRFVEEDGFKEKPESLSISAHALRDLRAEIILAAGRAFAPALLLADTNPHGKRDELLPLLMHLRARRSARVCLLMRDIPCPPGESFKLNGEAAQVRRHAAYYDRLLLAGDERFFDPAESYGWPEAVRERARMIGFVVPDVGPAARAEVLHAMPQINPAHPLVVASFGGGWEVEEMLDLLLHAVATYRQRKQKPAQLAAITGPAYPEEKLVALQDQAEALGGVVIRRFIAEFPALLAQADLAVLQAGSTPFQLLDGDVPIVVTARDYKSREQDERARRLAQFPGIRLIERDGDAWDDPAEWIEWGLDGVHPPRRSGLRTDGAQRAAEAVLELL